MSICCTSSRKDFLLSRGTTWRQAVRLRVKATQEPIDLSGCTARVVVRRGTATGPILADLTTESGAVTIDVTQGRIEWVLQMDFEPGTLHYSANYTTPPPEGDVRQPVHGIITLRADPNYTPTT
jgi:hypothetical protein